MKRTMLFSIAVYVGFSLLYSVKAYQQTNNRNKTSEQTNTEKVKSQSSTPDGVSWVNSFSAFVREVAEWGGDKPAATLMAMSRGQVVPPTKWEIMKKYVNQKVTWEASFQGLKRDSPLLSDGPKEMDKVDLKLEAAGFHTMIHAYTRQTEVARWKELSAGSRFSFRARVVGITYFQASPGLMLYVFMLQDAELVKVLP